MDAVRVIEQRFHERIRARRVWSWIALDASRMKLAIAIATAPALLLLASVAWGPVELRRALTDPANVHATFARFIGAVATASAIAVSLAQLVLRREMKGIKRQEERHQANIEYRERVREASGRAEAPISLSAFLALAFDSLAETATRARSAATRDELVAPVEDATLVGYLDAIERVARRSAAEVRNARGTPEDLAEAMMDFEEEMSSALARRFARDERLCARTRDAMRDLCDRIHDVVIGAKYAKTLGTQWGMGRMSFAITVATIPAIVVAAGMSLAYGEGAREALGLVGAGAMVAAAWAIVLLPIAFFVSDILRFVFLNQHTLPTDAFVLGPEEPAVVARETTGTGSSARGRSGA